MVVTVVALAVLALRRPVADLRPLRLSIIPPAGMTFTPKDISGMPDFAVSPDGSRLAFVASGPGARPQLWVQELGSAAAQPLPGTTTRRDRSGHPTANPRVLRARQVEEGFARWRPSAESHRRRG